MASSTAFNPVKTEKNGVRARRVIWSTESLELGLQALEQGKKLIANPFYENKTKLLKGDLVFQRTPEEISEWKKCARDIIYFVEKYCKLMTPTGVKHVLLRDYQKRYLRHLEKSQLSIYLACRQCGKTTTSAIFMLHYILFNVDKNALVLGNKFKTAKEILSKAKQIFQELPYFLKPGIYKWNEAEIVLDNGCRLMAEATTINSGISYTFHCVLADEFAHVAPNILDKFYNNLFPTITAGKARFMITSTQNGYNLFCRLYKAAEAGENDYKSFVTDWWEVPEWNPETQTWEKRDEEWHQRQVANYGSEEAFNKQFGTNFDVSANTLISQRIIGKFKQSLCEFINMDLPGVLFSNNWFWHPDYVPSEQLRRDYIVITCDLAEGGGGDYTTFMIHRMVVPGSDRLECIGYFHANTLNREQCALSLLQLLSMYCNPDCILLSFEKNTYGDLFMKSISDILNKFPFIAEKIDYSCFVKYKTSSTSNSYTYGIKITSGNKSETCLLYKDDYEKDMIRNESLQYMIELNNFTDDGTGHYKASFGHDDMVMASIQVEFVKQTLQYKLMRDTYDSTLGMTAGSEQDINWYSNEYTEAIDPSYAGGQTFYDLNSQPSDFSILNRFK